MATFRINKNNNYTVMSNYHLKDKNLSLKAKGLLSLMLSLPENWDYSINGLVSICLENETAIKSALKELKDNSYLEIIKIKPTKEKNKFDYIYNIYETPNQEGDFLGVESLALENQGQLNTNILNTKELNTNINNIIRFKKPTIEEIQTYCLERNNNIDAYKFYNYYESNGWKVGKNKMKNWKAAIRTWETNSKQKNNSIYKYNEEI